MNKPFVEKLLKNFVKFKEVPAYRYCGNDISFEKTIQISRYPSSCI